MERTDPLPPPQPRTVLIGALVTWVAALAGLAFYLALPGARDAPIVIPLFPLIIGGIAPALIDISRTEGRSRLWWMLCLFYPPVGATVYYLLFVHRRSGADLHRLSSS